MLALDPDHYDATLLKAQIHLLLNERSDASELYVRLKKHQQFDRESKAVKKLNADINRRGRFRGYIGYRLSYDNNLAAIPDVDELFVPVLNETLLLQNNQKQSGVRNTFYLGGRYSYVITDDIRWINDLYLGYSDDDVYSRYRLTAKSGLALTNKRWRNHLGLVSSWDKTEHSQQYLDSSLVFSSNYALSNTSLLKGRVGVRALDYQQQNSRDQSFLQLGIGLEHKLNDFWRLKFEHDHWASISSESGLSSLVPDTVPAEQRYWDQAYDRSITNVGVEHQISEQSKLKLNLKYSTKSYSELDPAFQQKREDEQWSARLSYHYRLPRDLRLSVGVSALDNQSNYDLVNYDKAYFYINLSHLF